jgi:hypothetical protein
MRIIPPPGRAKRKEGDGLDEAPGIKIRAKSLNVEENRLNVEVPSLTVESQKLNNEAWNLNGEARKLDGEGRKLSSEARKLAVEAQSLAVELRKLKGELRKLDGETPDSKFRVRRPHFGGELTWRKKECLPRPDTIRYTLNGSPRNAPPGIQRRIVDSPGLQ